MIFRFSTLQRLGLDLVSALLLFAFVSPLAGQNPVPIITTYAGGNRTFTGNGQPAIALSLSKVSSVALDGAGNPVFALRYLNVVLRLNQDGTVTRLAGTGDTGFSPDGLQATNSTFNSPQGVAFDSNGNLYIADTGNNVVRKVSALDGTISTFAGGGNETSTLGDGGQAKQAFLNSPISVVADSSNNIYIDDLGNARIRKVSPSGTISTYAGGGSSPFLNNLPATSLSLADPEAIALDKGGNLYIADFGENRVFRVNAQTNSVTNVAGTGIGGAPTEGGIAAVSPLLDPGGVAVDSQGNIYLSDTGNFAVRKISPSGIINTVVGNGRPGFFGDGGPALMANLNGTFGLAVDAQFNLFLADRDNFRVRRVDAGSQTISTVAGNGKSTFDSAVPAVDLLLSAPTGVTIAPDGSLFIADSESDVVRRIMPNGSSFTVAGTGGHGFSGDQGLATSAELSFPYGVGFDALGNFYIADLGNSRIRKVEANGIITTVAGTGTPGYNGDTMPAVDAELSDPTSVALDGSGNMYIADYGNNRVRRVSAGVITTVAGQGTNVELDGPTSVALDQKGNLIIADSGNHRVLSLAPSGVATPVAGGGATPAVAGGGAATAAALGMVFGVATDGQGNLYFSDAGNDVVQKVTPSGLLVTVAGNGKAGSTGDGGSATAASLTEPFGLAVDQAGNVFIADEENDRVRVVFGQPPTFQASPSSLIFNAASAGLPITQTLTLTSAIAGVPFVLSVPSNASWLTVSPSAGETPATIIVTADPTQLQQSTLESSITVNSPTAAPPTQNLSVQFNVGPAQPAKIALTVSQLSFAFSNQSAAESRALQIGNSGGGTLTFAAAATTGTSSSWLQVSPPSGTATAVKAFSLTVTVDPTGLAPGTYVGAVTLTNTAGGSSPTTVPVTVTVSNMPQTMVLSQTGLTFTGVQGGGVVPPKTFEVVNKGQGTMNWTVAAGLPNWLLVSPLAGQSVAGETPPAISVQVNPGGLTAGTYYAQIAVTSPTAANSPQLLTVVLNLLSAGQDPGPVVQPSGLIFTANAGGPNPAPQAITISDLAAVPITMGSSRTFLPPAANWFVHDPINATITPNSPLTITVTPLIAGLPPGVYSGALSLIFSDTTITAVAIRLIIAESTTGSDKLGHGVSSGCTPTQLVPVFTTLPNGFVAATGWPTNLVVKVFDDCKNPLINGSVVVSFSNGDQALPLISLQDGRWSGTWPAVNALLATTSLTGVAMTANPPPIRGSVTIVGSVNQNPDPPVVNAGGVVSAASFLPGAPLAPGSFISIYGTQLSDATAAATSLPLEPELQDVVVQIGTTKLPLQYVGAGQINAVLPYDVNTNTTHPLVVLRAGHNSNVNFVQIADAQPAIFKTGSQQGAILDQNNQLIQPGNPARAGAVAVIFCTGLGAVNGDVQAGMAAPGSPPATTVNPVSVSIGGLDAPVQFSGLAPGFAGLYQVNAVIPTGVSPSDSVAVIVTAGTLSSAPATIAIAN